MFLPMLLALLGPARALELHDAQAILLIETQRLPPLALAAYLEHPDPATRARAVRAVAHLRDTSAIAALRRVVADEDVEVRREVAFALAQTPGSMPLIVTRLAEELDPVARARLIDGMGRLGDGQVVGMLLSSLQEHGGFLRGDPEAAAAATALGRLAMREVPEARTPVVAEALLDLLERPDRSARRAAAFALGRLELPTLREPTRGRLLRMSRLDPDPVVRAFLLRAAAGLDLKTEERQELFQAAAADSAVGVRVALARAAGRHAWPGLLALSRDPERAVRREAIPSLAMGSVEGSTERLLELARVDLASPGPAQRPGAVDPRLVEAALAVRALASQGRLPEPETWLALERPTRVRAAAVRAILDPARLAELALKDAEPEVRSAAAEALLESRPPAALVLKLLDAFDPVVAALAAEHLAANPDPQMDGPLVSTLKSADNGELLKAAADALRERWRGHPNPPMKKDASLLTALQALLDHPEAGTREAASRLLKSLGQKPPVPPHRLLPVDLEQVGRIQGARILTSRGEVRVDLLPEVAPLTVWNFSWLSDQGYYDNVEFHRVVSDFVVQAGDPRGDGYGGPGWTIPDELSPLPYDEGVLGMALSGPDTGGSQWFITLSPQPHLDGGYTIFGRVTQGLGILRQIQPDDRIERVIIERRAAP